MFTGLKLLKETALFKTSNICEGPTLKQFSNEPFFVSSEGSGGHIFLDSILSTSILPGRQRHVWSMCTLHFVIILLLREFMRGIKWFLSTALIRNGLEEKFILHEHYSHKRVQTFSHRVKYQNDQQMFPLQQIQQTPFHVNRWNYTNNQMLSFFWIQSGKSDECKLL